MSATKKLYVYSLLASAVQYNLYGEAQPGGSRPIVGSIVVNGGAGVADKNFQTPDGAVITPITEDDATMLEQDPVFQMHKKNGFVRIDEAKLDGEQAAVLQGSLRDSSAPVVPSDYESMGARAPIVNNAVEDGTTAPSATAPKSTKATK